MRPLLSLSALLLAAGAAAAERPAMPEPTGSDRVLIVSPHPDDGALCCAGYLQRARDNGAQVAIVWMTAGDAFSVDALVMNRRLHERGAGMIALGLRRIGESLSEARFLDIPREHLFVLGYPDAGLAALRGEYHDKVYVSPHTLSPIVPYGEAMSYGGEITGRNLERDLAKVIDGFDPTLVFAPHGGDIHPDHSSTGDIVQQLLQQRGQLKRLHRYVIHATGHYPSPRRLRPELPLDPPDALAALPWRDFAISEAERDGKLQALRLYHSQWAVMAPYLESFVRRNELFLPE
jgi:LmbE family N-acetylglucosaminyl deacetylase